MRKAIRWLDRHFEEVLMAIFLGGIVVMMTIHVFFRYVMKSPLTWTEEATRYMFIWFVFMGVSYGLRNDTHIRVNIIETLYPKVISFLSLVQDIVSAAFIFYMMPAAFISIQTIMARNQASAGMHLPMVYVYGSLLFALCLSVIRIVQKFYYRIFKHTRISELESEEKEDKTV